ncbi:hypothetical protein HYZ99_02305 [Candidatus Peregrinibacteria bacterium]|nr:hypothetical protein [Candidatus Peregrinibacteria bacterium]
MFDAPSSLFGVVGVFYGLLLPLVILHIITLLFIPSVVLGGGGKVMSVGKAIYCYLLQAVGILLMTLGGLPAIYGVLARQPYESTTYLALLIVFASGGLTFLWHDHMARGIEGGARAVPHAIYLFTFKVMGYIMTLLSAMSLLLTLLLGTQAPTVDWWVMPTILLLYGLLLSWCTRSEDKGPSVMPKPKMMPMMAKKR